MKVKLVALTTAVLIGLTSTSLQAAVELSTDKDKLSYSIGADLGKNFKAQGIEMNLQAFLEGMQDASSAEPKLKLTEQQMKDTLATFQKDMMAKHLANLKKRGEENKTKGEAFLSANKSKPGVISLPSGLQYKVVTMGTGAKPSKNDMVTVEYTGQLINGEVFDSTEKSGHPATFQVSQVIPGWTEVLQLMPAGSTWEVFIPSALAYGAQNVGKVIGPNETLVFKIKLLSVNNKAA